MLPYKCSSTCIEKKNKNKGVMFFKCVLYFFSVLHSLLFGNTSRFCRFDINILILHLRVHVSPCVNITSFFRQVPPAFLNRCSCNTRTLTLMKVALYLAFPDYRDLDRIQVKPLVSVEGLCLITLPK